MLFSLLYGLPLSFILVSLGLLPPSQCAQKQICSWLVQKVCWHGCHRFVGGVRLMWPFLSHLHFPALFCKHRNRKNVRRKQNMATDKTAETQNAICIGIILLLRFIYPRQIDCVHAFSSLVFTLSGAAQALLARCVSSFWTLGGAGVHLTCRNIQAFFCNYKSF